MVLDEKSANLPADQIEQFGGQLYSRSAELLGVEAC